MKPIHNIGLINTLNAINRLINNLGFKHLKAPILTQLIKFRVYAYTSTINKIGVSNPLIQQPMA
jgi:hypothetical protein